MNYIGGSARLGDHGGHTSVIGPPLPPYRIASASLEVNLFRGRFSPVVIYEAWFDPLVSRRCLSSARDSRSSSLSTRREEIDRRSRVGARRPRFPELEPVLKNRAQGGTRARRIRPLCFPVPFPNRFSLRVTRMLFHSSDQTCNQACQDICIINLNIKYIFRLFAIHLWEMHPSSKLRFFQKEKEKKNWKVLKINDRIMCGWKIKTV